MQQQHKWLRQLPFWLSFISLIGFIEEVGFDVKPWVSRYLNWLYLSSIIVGQLYLAVRYLKPKERPPSKVWLFDAVLFMGLTLVLLNFAGMVSLPVMGAKRYLFLGVVLIFLREFSGLNINITKGYLNPAQLFIASFLFIIFCGSLLLMLPNATHSGISYLNALFTSTSAVCVTGLIVVDTGSYFTQFGQSIILILIQVGGLGIMTFTSYFSYFFTGGASYENQLMLGEITNSDKLAEVFSTLKKIIILTFSIEAVGALLIYIDVDPSIIPPESNRLFFSIFHSISGFCNAGFSTLSNSLYDAEFKFNYSLQLVIAFLFILGGIGFPILFNFARYLRYLIMRRLPFALRKGPQKYMPWIININTRIVLITTAILLVIGSVLFLWLEYDNTLAEHNLFGKLVTAFFGAATPRTAGFNSVDMSSLGFTTVMIIFFLMWIGASPGSTGGGIKTSTLAIATLNFMSHARGKERIEVFTREISGRSVQRAFAIISLSLVIIGAAVALITTFDRDKTLLSIAFESFSAYSTVGLSLGITADLSSASKMVIIFTMFIGRVSMLTILVALLRKANYQTYRYPNEHIVIN